MPTRVQRTRTKGKPGIPPGAIYVGRGTRWGNPTRVVYRRDTGSWHAEHDGAGAVGGFQTAAEARQFATAVYEHHVGTNPDLVAAAREELAGRDLACWCPLPEPGQPDHCHGAVLLRLANGGDL